MRHLGVHTRLRADAEVIHHAVGGGEAFFADGAQVFVQPHEALADFNASVTGEHVPRAVWVAVEHGADGVFVRLANAGFGYADDAHTVSSLCI